MGTHLQFSAIRLSRSPVINLSRRQPPMDGFLLIDKPASITSHDVVDRLRRITGIRQIGHAGTLDPFATGLLIVGIGKATKGLVLMMGKPKEYVGTLVFGATSDTQDGTGILIQNSNVVMPTKEIIANTIPHFTGEILQTPPM